MSKNVKMHVFPSVSLLSATSLGFFLLSAVHTACAQGAVEVSPTVSPALPRLIGVEAVQAAPVVIGSLAAWLAAYRSRPEVRRYEGVLGSPRGGFQVLPFRASMPDTLGTYTRKTGRIAIAVASHSSAWDFRHTYLHELSHVFQDTHGSLVQRKWKGVRRIADSTAYGFGQVLEQQAEALAFAFGILEDIEDGKANAAYVCVKDREYPGVAAMVSLLLENPAFSSHPLRGSSLSRLCQGLHCSKSSRFSSRPRHSEIRR